MLPNVRRVEPAAERQQNATQVHFWLNLEDHRFLCRHSRSLDQSVSTTLRQLVRLLRRRQENPAAPASTPTSRGRS